MTATPRGAALWVPPLVVALLGLALTLTRLGDSALWDPWEPRYAQTAREMTERADWIVPHYREEPRLNRPPMTYWLIGLSQGALGVNEVAARLPSALLAVLCPFALAWAFATRGRPWEGLLCGAALLTAPQWLLLGRFATPAMPLAALLGILLAVALALPAVSGRGARRFLFALAVVLLAAAMLTNWPRALVLPAWAVLGWAAVELRRAGIAALFAVAAVYHAGQLWHSPSLIVASFVLAVALAVGLLARYAGVPPRVLAAGGVLVAALAAPWFLALVGLDPGELKLFNYKYALNLGEEMGSHTGPFAYPLHIVAVGALPWSAAAVAGILRAFGRNRDDIAGVLTGAFGGTLAFFLLSEPRMGHFYAVVQPALAGLAAVGIVRLVRRRDWIAIPTAIVLLAVSATVLAAPSRLLDAATVKRSLDGIDVATPALIATALWAAALLAAWLRRSTRWSVACVVPALALSATLAIGTVPALGPSKSLGGLWKSYLEERRAGEPIALLGSSRSSIFYYSNNRIVRLDDANELRDFLAGPGSKFVIVARRNLARIEPQNLTPGARWETLDESHRSYALIRVTPPR